ITGVAADEAIGVGNAAADPRGAAAPSCRPALAVPVPTSDHIVAVAQGGDATVTDRISGVATKGAIGGGNDTADPGAATSPGRCPTGAVPSRATDHVVAVAQESDAIAHLVAGTGADEAVGTGDGAGDAGRAATPSRRPAIAVPIRAAGHVVAVAQGDDVLV